MKKIISILLSVLLTLGVLSPVVAFAEGEIETLNIDYSSLKVEIPDGKSTAVAGDTLSVSFKINDNTAFEGIIIDYYSPSGEESYYDYKTYDTETKTVTFSIPITKKTESGEWKIFVIAAIDADENEKAVYNSMATSETPSANLSAGNFTVEGNVPDTEPPVIDVSSLSLDKKTVAAGDKVKLSLSISDESETSAYIYLESPSNSSTRYNLTYNESVGKFECEIPVTEYMQAGTWSISGIYASDDESNQASVQNDGKGNLSAGDFIVQRSISSVYIGKINDVKYRGEAITPEPFISDGNDVLLKDRDYTLSYLNNINEGKATIIIKGINGYTGTAYTYFNIYGQPKPAPIIPTPTVKKPAKAKITKLSAGKKAFTVKWKKQSSISGYQVQYSLKKNFKSAKIKTVKKSKTKLTVKKLKKGKKYYVRVRAYKTVNGKKYYGKWSAKKAVRIK